ncbi:MAG: metallophosphoesterase [Elusimicrobia bacterium]|nr:metallophosphoesterase [Elusimicrobiota bacterium]
MKRTIIIGDVHGCSAELKDLLRAVNARPDDRLISVGDLINKGPDSRGVMEWAMGARNLECVVGNHELRFVNCWRRSAVPRARPHDEETWHQLGDLREAAMRYAASWPLTIDGGSFLVVHAGFDPRKSLGLQSVAALTDIRRLRDTDEPWYESYRGRQLVVYGHWSKPAAVVRPNSIGLDTGCVYGGALTALILPERRLVSVPARRVYREKEGFGAALAAA